MKEVKIFATILAFLIILSLPTSSAEVIFNNEPEGIYNLGDIISVPITIKAAEDISGTLEMNLVCKGEEQNFYKNGISLEYGQEIKLNPSLLLNKDMIGDITGKCKIKTVLGEEILLTQEFEISDLIEINLTDISSQFVPEQNYIIDGEAIREDGSVANGFVDMQILAGEEGEVNLTKSSSVNEGYFSLNFTLPENTASGKQLLNLEVYEKSQGEITNHGKKTYSINVKQIPTNLELFFESSEIEPGKNLEMEAILRDQTGKNIETNVNFKIKNSERILIEEINAETYEIVEYATVYNQPPEKWEVIATSEELSTKSSFEILPLEKIDIQLINKTVIVTNVGNVEYNQTLSIKIGGETEEIDVTLGVDESEKYFLYAPNGEYNVEVSGNEENLLTGSAVLTGDAINIKKASDGMKSLVRYPISWIFLIAILGFMITIIFRKNYGKKFVKKLKTKKATPKKEKFVEQKSPSKKDKKSLINPRNIAELSLSIKGNMQTVSVVGLKIKNVSEIKEEKGMTSETLQKIVNLAEENKAYIYKNQEYLFFILAPGITKTFKNEKTAILLSKEIKSILDEHNKKFKKKISFGLALNTGEIVAKMEAGKLKFMSMKTLVPGTKKIAGESNEEVLLSKKFNERLDSSVKTAKSKEHYKVTEMIDRGEHKAFISSFLKRMEKDKNKKN